MLDTGYWILDAGCLILDTGYLMLDAGCSMLDTGCLQKMLLIKNPPQCGTSLALRGVGSTSREAHRTRLWLAPAVDPGCSRGKGLLSCKPDKLEVPKVS